MAAAIDIQESFVEPERRRVAPDWQLTPNEQEDLRLFFDGAEGLFGVRSSQGALEDELNRRAVGDQSKWQIAMENRLRAIKRRKPKKTAFSSGFASLYSMVGLRAPVEREDDDEVPGWARSYMSPGQGHAYAVYVADVDLKAAGRVSHVRQRLIIVGTNWQGVLFASHGPQAAKWGRESKGNPEHPVTKLGGAHLAEIAVSILAFENYMKGDKVNARAQLWTAMSGAGADTLRIESRKLFGRACSAYKISRCPRPCPRCWPQ